MSCSLLLFLKKSSPIHFAFDQSRPFFRIGFIVESLVLGREAISNDLGLPLIRTTFSNCRHNFSLRKRGFRISSLWHNYGKKYFLKQIFLNNGLNSGEPPGFRSQHTRLKRAQPTQRTCPDFPRFPYSKPFSNVTLHRYIPYGSRFWAQSSTNLAQSSIKTSQELNSATCTRLYIG